MELTPNPAPRQRNRRADRTASPAPETPVVQQVQTGFQEPVQAVSPSQAVPRPQAPRSMYQQPDVSVRPSGYAQPAPTQNGFLQQRPQRPVYQPPQPIRQATPPAAPAQPIQPMPQMQPAQDEAAVRPRAAADTKRPQVRTSASFSAEEARAEARKVPSWMTTALCLSLILAVALFAAYWLMQAYLTTQENARIAAHQAVLDNYHITQTGDGTLRVTWQDEIEYYAAKYNLQPAFVMAIIRNESSFRTQAESNVGARGLMQMMPDTAEWIAGKLDDDSYTFDSMWDGETNIRYGCWYLSYLCRLFRGDAQLVSAAYHAGQTTITQWLSDPNKSSDGLTLDLDRLNDGPTKQYIGRVTQAYGIYQELLYPDAVSADSAGAAAFDR